ncbi:MAG TPA: hypothetical protein VF103_06880, partial [Polyangiaceae bacterium]
APSVEGPPKERPRFAWPAAYGIPVRERATKRGHVADMTYLVRTCPAANGRLRVEHAEFRFLSFDGIPAEDPRVLEALQLLAPLLAAIPAFIVDSSGRVLDLEGVDEMLATFAKTLPDEKADAVVKAFSGEQGRAIFKQATFARWRAWVESWLAYEPERGPRLDIEAEAFGQPQKHELSFDGWSGKRARLSLRSKFSKETVRAMLASLFGAFGATGVDLQKIEASTVEHTTRVETDWPEIRPYSVVTEQRISITFDGKTVERNETHDYRFDWANAKPVTCPPR